MADVLPTEVARLLEASSPVDREREWEAFLVSYNGLLLSVSRSMGGDHDAVMDRYAYILEWLRRDGFARLRRYVPDAGCRFSTWLVVVARRLALDHRRRQYGQSSKDAGPRAREQRDSRRRLAQLLGEQLELDALPAPETDTPELEVRSNELRVALDDALAQLEPSDRLLLKLRFEFDVPVKEIAEIVHAPSVFHIYRSLNRLLPKLRAELVRRGVADPTP